MEGGNEEDTENKIVWGRNKKIDKTNRERYGRADLLNRITGHTAISIEEALAWMSILLLKPYCFYYAKGLFNHFATCRALEKSLI